MIPMAFLNFVFQGLWWAFKMVALAAAAYGIAYVSRKKSSGGASDPLDTSRFPRVEESEAYPVIFGTPRIDGYDVPWTGNVRVFNHKRSDVVVYKWYTADAHIIYCQGPIDGFKQFWYGDAAGGKCAWPVAQDQWDTTGDWEDAPETYAADGLTSTLIDAWFLYGGPYASGGIYGEVDFCLGAWDQAQNAYLASVLDANIPAFRGLAAVVFKNRFRWGNAPMPMVLAALPKRVLIESRGEERWYVAKAPIGTGGLDLNACHILRECLTDLDWGEAMDADDLGDTWTAVADTCYTEGLGLSASYQPEPGNLKQFVADLLDVMDAVLYDDPDTGDVQIKLLRDDYEIADLPVFTERDFEVVSHVQRHWRDVPGRVLVKYTDRQHPNDTVPAPYEDAAIIDKQGGRVAEKVLEYPMICDADLAADVAARKGRAATGLLTVMTLECKGIMAGLHKGQPFKISYSVPGLSITQMVVRVVEREFAGSEDPSFTMEVMEDVYKAGYTIRTVATSTWTETTPAESVTVIDSLAIAAEEATFDIINEVEA